MNPRVNYLWYQCIALFLFLAVVAATASLDYALPIYILISALPFAMTLRNLKGWFCLFYYLVIAAYLIYGALFQSTYAAITTFCTRFYQFMVLMWIYRNPSIRAEERHEDRLLTMLVVMEAVLAAYLMASGQNDTVDNAFRLVSGNQPISGNLAVVFLPLLIFCYFRRPARRTFYLALWLVLTLLIVASGTRGYLILFVVPFLPALIHFVTGGSQPLDSAEKKLAAVCLIAAAVLALVLVTGDMIPEKVAGILRLNAGVGRRGRENRIVAETFSNTTWKYQLFGMGFGGAAKNVPGYVDAVRHVWGSSWGFSRYASMKGVSFHSLYSNVLLIQGVFGCALMLMIFIWGMMRVLRCNLASRQERFCLLLYWVCFFLMNHYRWSCDCGIAEMMIFAVVLNRLTGDDLSENRMVAGIE